MRNNVTKPPFFDSELMMRGHIWVRILYWFVIIYWSTKHKRTRFLKLKQSTIEQLDLSSWLPSMSQCNTDAKKKKKLARSLPTLCSLHTKSSCSTVLFMVLSLLIHLIYTQSPQPAEVTSISSDCILTYQASFDYTLEWHRLFGRRRTYGKI